MGRILALDVSECNTGWAVVTVLGQQPEMILASGTITTAADRKIKPKGADDIRRVSEIAVALREIAKRYEPDAIVAELPYGSQSAAAAKSAGICLGVLGSLRVGLGLPCQWVTPQAGKGAVCGSCKASKEAVQEAIIEVWPEVGTWKKHEHIADALAGLVVARTSDLYLMVARIRP